MENLTTTQLECLKKYSKEQVIKMKVNMFNCKKLDNWVDELSNLNLKSEAMFIAEINRSVWAISKAKLKDRYVSEIYERKQSQTESEGRPMKNFLN